MSITFFYDFLIFLNYWFPWFNFLIEVYIIQYFIIYSLYLLLRTNNVYYLLLYSIIFTFLIGLFLSFYGLELFTAFLWLVELTVFFIFLLLLFYVNIKGVSNSSNTIQYNYFYFFFIFFFLITCFYSDSERSFIYTTNLFSYYSDFYNAFNTTINNDFYGIFLFYYFINFVEFIFVGLILLIGSFFCVSLFRVNSTTSVRNYVPFFKVFNFLNDYVNFFFLRKQNLTKQGFFKESLKVYKKI